MSADTEAVIAGVLTLLITALLAGLT